MSIYPYKYSICIPTWNRVDYLKVTLENIYQQINNNINFQIVISDNNSTDGTNYLINDYFSKLKIKYIRRERNIGGSPNIVSTINNADGQYCIILGDDDVFRHGWLNSLDSFIDAYNPDVISSDRIVCKVDLSPIFIEKCGPIVVQPTLYKCSERDVLINYLSQTYSTSGFGFLSNLIVKRSAWINSIECPFVNNHPFPHMIKIMDILGNNGGSILRVPLETVYARSGNDRLEEIMLNNNPSEFEKMLVVHFEGFLSAAKFVFPDSKEKRFAMLNPIRKIFTSEYRLKFIKNATLFNLNSEAENFLNSLDIEIKGL